MTSIQNIQTSFSERHYVECLKLIDKLPHNQQNKEILRLKAFCLQRSEQHEAAMEVWNILIANDVKCAEYYAERGVCKLHLKFKSTLSDFNTAVDLDPNNPYRYACRAFVKDKLGDIEGAIVDYKTSIELDPENEVTLNNLGLLEEKLGYQSHAENRYKQADALAQMRESLGEEVSHETKNSEIPIIPYNQPSPDQNSTGIFDELKKMLSSWTEFKKFLNEAFQRKV